MVLMYNPYIRRLLEQIIRCDWVSTLGDKVDGVLS